MWRHRSTNPGWCWCFENGRKPNKEEIEIWNTFTEKRSWRDSSSQGFESEYFSTPFRRSRFPAESLGFRTNFSPFKGGMRIVMAHARDVAVRLSFDRGQSPGILTLTMNTTRSPVGWF